MVKQLHRSQLTNGSQSVGLEWLSWFPFVFQNRRSIEFEWELMFYLLLDMKSWWAIACFVSGELTRTAWQRLQSRLRIELRCTEQRAAGRSVDRERKTPRQLDSRDHLRDQPFYRFIICSLAPSDDSRFAIVDRTVHEYCNATKNSSSDLWLKATNTSKWITRTRSVVSVFNPLHSRGASHSPIASTQRNREVWYLILDFVQRVNTWDIERKWFSGCIVNIRKASGVR